MGIKSFSDFIDKLSSINDEPEKEIKKPKTVIKEEVKEEIKEEVKIEHQIKETEVLEEDFNEKAFDYAYIFIKNIKSNFKDKSQRRIIFESVKSAINTVLGEQHTVVTTPSIQKTPIESIQAPQQAQSDQPMTEKEWDSMPTVVVDNPVAAPLVMNENYSRGFKSDPTKIGANGRPEFDVSSIDSKDMAEMQYLANYRSKDPQKTEANK